MAKLPPHIDPKLHGAFIKQKHSAKRRGIGFYLTYDEWLDIWERSGFLHLRGKLKGQYCMGRPLDQGDYTIGNVEVITNRQNHLLRTLGKKPTVETREKIANFHRGRPKSEEHKLKLSKPKSDSHREKLRVAGLAYFARKKGLLPANEENDDG
jgi:hypothetical protein